MSELYARPLVRLVLLHGHALFRESLARLLASEPEFELVAECPTPAEALAALNGAPADIVLLDFKTSNENGDDFIRASRRAGYQGKFLIVTSMLDVASCATALKLGASGIFLESGSSARLFQAIRLVASGETWIDHAVIQLLAERYPHGENLRLRTTGLTHRQQAVLEGVVDGLTNRRIGDRLGVSEGTIKSTLQQLFDKTGVRTRTQLVRAALNGSGDQAL